MEASDRAPAYTNTVAPRRSGTVATAGDPPAINCYFNSVTDVGSQPATSLDPRPS